MQQLQFKFFFPLTEQNELNLDYKPCLDYAEEQRKKQLYSGYNFNTWSPNGAGYWQVGESLRMHNETTPSRLHQKMTNIFFGWKWKDK